VIEPESGELFAITTFSVIEGKNRLEPCVTQKRSSPTVLGSGPGGSRADLAPARRSAPLLFARKWERTSRLHRRESHANIIR
jgi:hypothetical protein